MADQDRVKGRLRTAKVWVGFQQHFHILSPVIHHICPASRRMIEEPSRTMVTVGFMRLHFLGIHYTGDCVGQHRKERARAGGLRQANSYGLGVNRFPTVSCEASDISE